MRAIRVITIAFLAVMVGVVTPIGAAENNKIVTGKQLPWLVKEAVKSLQRDIPQLSGLPEGYAVTLNDVVFVEKYADLSGTMPPEAVEFAKNSNLTAMAVNHTFPVYIFRESRDYQIFQKLESLGHPELAAGLLKSVIAHEASHVWFRPAQGLSALEAERQQEIAANTLELQILKRDIVAGKLKGLGDVTTDVEDNLRQLRRSDVNLAAGGFALILAQ